MRVYFKSLSVHLNNSILHAYCVSVLFLLLLYSICHSSYLVSRSLITVEMVQVFARLFLGYHQARTLTGKIFCWLDFSLAIDIAQAVLDFRSVSVFMSGYSTTFLSSFCISSIKVATRSYSLEQIFNYWKCQATLIRYCNIPTSEQG